MTDALTHERCSELLGDFAGGRLDVAEGARVEAHLESCPDCSAELRAVMALRVEDEPLTDMERARVRKGVGDRLGEGAAQRSRPERAPGRLAAALGVAALLAIGGVAVVSLGSDFSSEFMGALLPSSNIIKYVGIPMPASMASTGGGGAA